MPDRIRFHLDENVDPDVARALQRHGADVTTTPEVGLYSRSDQAQLEFVRKEGRVIVTHDTDFLRIASATLEHPGVVYCHRTTRTLGEIIKSLIMIYEILTPEEMSGHVEFI